MPYEDGAYFTEADTRAKLIDKTIFAVGWTEDHIRREYTAGRIELTDEGAEQGSPGRIDYVLRLPITVGTQAVAVAYIEAKREGEQPESGIDQARSYQKRLHVPFVFSTNGDLFPGFFRPQKKWDIVVARNGRLCAAVEFKSQVGSFGNNFNNRCEEAIGSSTDLWTAFREGALGRHPPWLGYFFLLERAEKSIRPVSLKSSAFPALSVFEGTSYAERYAILCERLVLERKYSATSLVMASRGRDGTYVEPVPGLGFYAFAKSLFAHLCGCV